MIDIQHSVLIVLIISLVTIILRIGPAWIFPPDKPTPDILVYLSKVMPPAVIGMLIIYCFRNIDFTQYPFGISEILSGIVTITSFLITKSTILSILFGTILYMFMIQVVF